MTAAIIRSDATLLIAGDEERIDATLSALRRRHRGDALEELARWRPTLWRMWCETEFPRTREVPPSVIELTRWVRDECRLHAEGGRFEHAIALIERYRLQASGGLTADAIATLAGIPVQTSLFAPESP